MHPSSPPPLSSSASSAAGVASRRQCLLVFIAALVAVLLAAPLSLQGAHAERAQTPWTLPDDAQLSLEHPPRPPQVRVNNRIVAVGDLHSDYPQTLAVLRLASMVDKDENWVGGQDTLIQTVMTLETRLSFLFILSLSIFTKKEFSDLRVDAIHLLLFLSIDRSLLHRAIWWIGGRTRSPSSVCLRNSGRRPDPLEER